MVPLVPALVKSIQGISVSVIRLKTTVFFPIIMFFCHFRVKYLYEITICCAVMITESCNVKGKILKKFQSE